MRIFFRIWGLKVDKKSKRHYTIGCILGIFITRAFVADFPPVAPEFYQRTHRVRLKNLGTPDKKSSHKIKHKKISRVHEELPKVYLL